MKVLVIDTGGTNVKMLAIGQKERSRFASGPKMTPRLMVAGVKKLAADREYDVVSLAHLSYKKGTYEDYLGVRGLERLGLKKWREHVLGCVERFVPALELDEVVLGGGNAKKLTNLRKCCRAGSNTNAFLGGFRLWKGSDASSSFPIRRS